MSQVHILKVQGRRALSINGVYSYSALSCIRMWASMRVYPKVSRLSAWSKNCKWCSSLPLGAVVLLFCESIWWVLPS